MGEVRANAEMLARAIAADNRDHISIYLGDSAKGDFFLILDELPRIEGAVVGYVSMVEHNMATCLMRLQAPKDEFVLRTVWIDRGGDIAIEGARFFEWGLKILTPGRSSVDLRFAVSEAS